MDSKPSHNQPVGKIQAKVSFKQKKNGFTAKLVIAGQAASQEAVEQVKLLRLSRTVMKNGRIVTLNSNE